MFYFGEYKGNVHNYAERRNDTTATRVILTNGILVGIAYIGVTHAKSGQCISRVCLKNSPPPANGAFQAILRTGKFLKIDMLLLRNFTGNDTTEDESFQLVSHIQFSDTPLGK